MTTVSKQWIQHNQVAIYAVAVLLAIGVGLGLPSASSVLEPLINPVLAVLLYVTFLEIPFVRIRRAFRNGRFMAAALGLNFVVVPIVVFGLTRFLSQDMTYCHYWIPQRPRILYRLRQRATVRRADDR